MSVVDLLGVTKRFGDVTAVEHPAADRASAYGLESIIVDGNDPEAVYEVATTAIGLGGSSLLGDIAHDTDEVVERLDALRLGRLHHQRLLHDQGEVDRRRMDAVVQDGLGDVERHHPVR